MSHGLKSFARELHKHGRHGDTIVAHINPQEAALLKSLGGSGTINPTTGLPEYWGGLGALNPFNKNSAVGKVVAPVVQPVANLATQVLQPVEKAVVQPVSNALVGLDKTVGKAIPGGWGTVAQVAGSMVGLPTPLMVGLGALNGSGVMHPGRGFNMQGAIMGGATAYAMAELGDYMRSAAPGAEGVAGVTPPPTVDAAGNLVNAATGEVGSGLAGNASGMVVDPSTLTSGNTAALNALGAPLEAGAGVGLQVAPPPSIGSQIMSGDFGGALTQAGDKLTSGLESLGTGIKEGATNLTDKITSAYDTVTNPETYSNAYDTAAANAGQTSQGLKNLVGLGEGTAKEAAKLAATSGVNPTMMAGLGIYGSMSLSQLEDQRNFLKDQQAAGAISQAEYNAALAEINRTEAIARNAVAEHPFSTSPDRSATIGETSYARNAADENLYGRSSRNLYDELAPRQSTYANGGEVKGYFDGGFLQAIANSGILAKLVGSSTQEGAAGAGPIGFQNLKSEGTPSGTAVLAEAVAKSVGKPRFAPSIGYLGDTLYEKQKPNDNIYDRFTNKKYAYGGSIDGEAGGDDNYSMGGNIPGYAAGGQPHFLSGGGDGMSDSIPATIDGRQEARLADGEFVIPADVVSHLGNGSSKAGAKQLYSMMNKVRKARTGNPRQGKQINPRKYLPA